MGGGAGIIGGRSGNVGDADFHAIATNLRQITNLIDEAKRLGLLGGQNGWFGSPIESTQDLLGRLCARLENVSGQLDVTAKALNRLLDSVERLTSVEAPIVLVKEEAAERCAGSHMAGQEDRHSSTPDMSDGMHMNLSG